jgi:hypothetical protein
MSFIKRLVCLVSLLTPGVSRADAPDLRALLIKYRCPIYDRLVRIHDAGDVTSDRHRFIVISLPDEHYVQCIFHGSARMFYCEASTGFYETKQGARRTAFLSRAAVERLAELGFSKDDTKGNLSLDRDIGTDPDYQSLADLMLTALYVGYGARAGMELKIDAPFAPHPDSSCDPLS